MALPPAHWAPSGSSRRVACPVLSGCHDRTMDGCMLFIRGDLGGLQVLGSHLTSPMPGSTVDWDVGTHQPLSIARYFFSDVDSLVHQLGGRNSKLKTPQACVGSTWASLMLLYMGKKSPETWHCGCFFCLWKLTAVLALGRDAVRPPGRSKQMWSNIFQVTLESKWHRITFWSHFWNCSLIVLVIGLLPASLFWKHCLLVPIHEVVSQCCVCFISCL